MLGKVTYITENIYQELGKLDEVDGHSFEKLMVQYISKELEPYFSKSLRIKNTSITRDDGRDIIITSSEDFQLFGMNFYCKNKRNITVYIECKSSKNFRIDRDKFSHNILAANSSDVDYLILLTNKSITPEAYFMAQENGQRNKYEFRLFDKILLRSIFEQYIPSTEVSISYQIQYGMTNDKNKMDVYILFQNHTSQKQLCKYKLKSNRNWILAQENLNVYLDPYCCISKKVTAIKEYSDGIDDLILNFEYNNQTKSVIINGSNMKYLFETPLVGAQHKFLVESLFESIICNDKQLFIHIYGEAGIGKTRIKDEILKKLDGTNNEILSYRCSECLHTGDKEEFINLLLKNNLENNKKSEFSKYVIIVEDFHHASKNLIEYIMNYLTNPNSVYGPVTFFILGRSDDTFQNDEYIRFISYSKLSKNIISKKVDKLESDASYSLIKEIINEVPQKVLDDIYIASENNPFYIIQFIEYLLENKLVNIINRNTVGIINAATFLNKIYIPKSIEELLEQRLYILKSQISERAYQFLLILAFKKNKCSSELFNIFLSSEDDTREYLFQHHLLKLEESQTNILFEHENIFRYCSKLIEQKEISKRISQIIHQEKYLFNSLSLFEKGKVYFQINNFKKASNCYQEIIDKVSNFKNVATENLPYYYLEYIEDIYFIFRANKNIELQRKCLLSELYISLHNITNGKAKKNIDKIENIIFKNHKNDTCLKITYKQMKMHYYMQCGNNLKAIQLGCELIAQERLDDKNVFPIDTKFNLFDRMSSLYYQLNHKELAKRYNELGLKISKENNDDNFHALSYMTASKICFFDDTKTSIKKMHKAQEYINKTQNIRLSCHNNLSIISAEMLLNTDRKNDFTDKVNKQLQIAQEISYPIAEIRAYYLLAVTSYLEVKQATDIDTSILYLDKAIELSIYNASIKMLPNIYNLKAIIATYQHTDTDLIFKYYNTMLQYLKQQNQLFLGDGDFTYSNIINLTNYALFLLQNHSENEFYVFMSQIGGYKAETFCNFNCSESPLCFYSCSNNLDEFQKLGKQIINKNKFINLSNAKKYNLRDKRTDYYIPLLV